MDADDSSTPTRRDALRAGGAVLTAGLFAGCTSGGDATPTDDVKTPTATPESGTTESTTESGPYTVSMAPMGDVAFDAPPENVFTVFPQYADMAVALGHGDAVNSVYVPEMSGTTMNHYYDCLDGVSFDWKGLTDPLSDGLSKELLFDLGSDVHFADPAWASTQNNWSQSDVEEVGSAVAPWFGNFYSGTHADPPEAYADSYQYYSLWDMFGKVAQVFRERQRYEALASVRREMLSTIEANLPPKEERPTAVRVTLSSDSFWTYHLNRPGYWLADTRPLGAIDAFAEKDWGQLWGQVGYEAMLEADPDVILHLWGMTPNYAMSDVRSQLEKDPVGKQLSAVQNGRVYAQGMRYQGPIMNLFQTEMTAKQLYPDVFGEWPEYTDGQPYPEIPEDEWLFDRTKVAAAVTGSVEE
ncbi:ABC transporter substrate-binding protein [Halobaculum sp. P14]|uniref:ABC transporter substrate-binding protein n=1 Tax=Halobaculum sp. P14 TaxID=3421638 RepID=UPI003EBAE6A4